MWTRISVYTTHHCYTAEVSYQIKIQHVEGEDFKNKIVWRQSFNNKYGLPRRALISGCSSEVEHVLGVLGSIPSNEISKLDESLKVINPKTVLKRVDVPTFLILLQFEDLYKIFRIH